MRACLLALACSIPLAPAGSGALIVREIVLNVNDVAYDASRGTLWASISGASPSHGNEVVPIDPLTGVVGAGIAVGIEPNALAISDDGAVLYVGHRGASEVRRIDLALGTTNLTFALPALANGPTYVEDIAVQPGNPSVVAISRQFLTVNPRHAGIEIYEDGVARPLTTQTHTGGNRIEFDASGAYLYGYCNESSESGLRRIRVDANGASEVVVDGTLIHHFFTDITLEGNQLVSGGGTSVDPAALQRTGQYGAGRPSTNAVLAIDAANAAVYQINLPAGLPHEVVVYDRDRFVARQTIAVPGLQGVLLGARNTGPGRFAFWTMAGELFLIDLGIDATDSDHDGRVDSVDNCPLVANEGQRDDDVDAIGNACDAYPLDPNNALATCSADRAAASAALPAVIAEVAQCEAAGPPDIDGDGEPDASDRCVNTSPLTSIDASGCSRAQFCTTQPRSSCKRADWRNDEPTAKKPGDCVSIQAQCAAGAGL